ELAHGEIDQWHALTDREIVLSAPTTLAAHIDPIRIGQVLTNLIENALKYGGEGSIEVGISRSPKSANITVRDHGPGVDPKDRAKLFERFYQAHPGRSGMGLGLYITRQIVELHGGRIYAEFPDDGGTRFVVSLPLD
ncbi:MAG TPA: HAMP domain-containing sensor histidine kinase, partial [Gemmatimonadales bacterium]|nr:HAMP domain-containing sensor histidine kinase [Gemmatimonadales bacterium]